MARELPRTLRSLSPKHQLEIAADDYEVIVVDNGSPAPVDPTLVEFGGHLRLERIDPAPPSPVRAANLGLGAGARRLVGLVIDGARMASPGLLAGARRARHLAERPVITAPAFHLGSVTAHARRRGRLRPGGRGRAARRLGLGGRRLPALRGQHAGRVVGSGSVRSDGREQQPVHRRAIWDELGGLDERFALPAGGLANHDLYRRACSLDGVELIVLLGEGTFHQYHGGAATSRRFTWDEMHADYQAIRNEPHRPRSTDRCTSDGASRPSLRTSNVRLAKRAIGSPASVSNRTPAATMPVP